MGKNRERSLSTAPRADESAYSRLAAQPLYVLCFLLPLIAFYEIGSALYLTKSGVVQTIGARSIVSRLFETFGVASLYLPGAMLAAVLVFWHLLLRHPWKVRPGVLIAMLLESVVWTMPILVLGLLLAGMARAAWADDPGPVQALTLGKPARFTLAVGAGIYEELLFRLIMITVIHFLLVDLGKLSNRWGCALAVIVSGVAFALYHNYSGPNGALDARLFAFYAVAGCYFGLLFLVRGFGIVVATHAIYDAIALVVFPHHA